MYKVVFFVAGTNLVHKVTTIADSLESVHISMALFIAESRVMSHWALGRGECIEWRVIGVNATEKDGLVFVESQW